MGRESRGQEGPGCRVETKAVGHVGRKSGLREGIICSAPGGVDKLDKSVVFYTQELHGIWEEGKILDLVAGTGITLHLISVTRGIDCLNRGSYDNVFLDDRSLCQLGRSRIEQNQPQLGAPESCCFLGTWWSACQAWQGSIT